jgi:hypothetical protein
MVQGMDRKLVEKKEGHWVEPRGNSMVCSLVEKMGERSVDWMELLMEIEKVDR